MRAGAGAVEVELDDQLGLAGRPLDACSAAHARQSSQSGAVLRRDLTQGGEEGVGLLRRAGGHPQPAGQPDVAHQHARGRAAPATPRRESAKCPNSTKLASLGTLVRPMPGSAATIRSRCGLDRVDGGQQRVGVRQRGPRRGLGQRAQVVGQPHQLQRVDHGGVGGQVAQPQPGHAERLAHRPADHQPRPAGQQGQRRRRARRGRTRHRPRRRPPCPRSRS